MAEVKGSRQPLHLRGQARRLALIDRAPADKPRRLGYSEFPPGLLEPIARDAPSIYRMVVPTQVKERILSELRRNAYRARRDSIDRERVSIPSLPGWITYMTAYRPKRGAFGNVQGAYADVPERKPYYGGLYARDTVPVQLVERNIAERIAGNMTPPPIGAEEHPPAPSTAGKAVLSKMLSWSPDPGDVDSPPKQSSGVGFAALALVAFFGWQLLKRA